MTITQDTQCVIDSIAAALSAAEDCEIVPATLALPPEAAYELRGTPDHVVAAALQGALCTCGRGPRTVLARGESCDHHSRLFVVPDAVHPDGVSIDTRDGQARFFVLGAA